MATRLIAYDLPGPDRDYTELIDAIKSMAQGWWHHLDSCWLIKTTLTASEVRDRLRPLLRPGDEILVIDVTGDARAWSGFSDRGSSWLKQTWD